jgi:hypothetical protein
LICVLVILDTPQIGGAYQHTPVSRASQMSAPKHFEVPGIGIHNHSPVGRSQPRRRDCVFTFV